jgi:hypothetical protein
MQLSLRNKINAPEEAVISIVQREFTVMVDVLALGMVPS